MQKRYLIITYAISITIFLLLAPAAIFYAKGYRWNLASGELTKTGSIEVKSKPKNAEIRLNGKLLAKRSPTEISNLQPGTYSLNLSKNGYMSWENTIEVEPELVSSASHIILFPQSPELTNLIKSPYLDDFQFSWDEKLIAYNITAGNKKGFWLLNIDKKTSVRLDPNNYTELVFSGDNQKILAKHNTTYYIFNLQNVNWSKEQPLLTNPKKPFKINLNFATKLSLNKLIWHPQDAGALFVQSSNELYELKLEDLSASLLLSNIITFTEADQKLYFIQDSTTTLSKQLGYLPLGLFNSSRIISQELPIASDYKIIARDNGRLAYLADEELYVWNNDLEKFIKIAKDITNAQWSVDLLFYNDHEIWIYYQEDKKSKLITRLSSTLDNIAWWPLSKYVIFSDTATNSINFIEISEILTKWQIFKFYQITNENQGKISFDAKGKMVWLLDKDEENNKVLRQIKILNN